VLAALVADSLPVSLRLGCVCHRCWWHLPQILLLLQLVLLMPVAGLPLVSVMPVAGLPLVLAALVVTLLPVSTANNGNNIRLQTS
jgi:hypothetical protein